MSVLDRDPRAVGPEEAVRAAPDGGTLCRFDADPVSVGSARRFVRAALEGQLVDETSMDIVLLLVSELATNAVIHAETEFDVVVTARHNGVRVEVVDVGGGCPSPMHPVADGDHGRGLTLVAALATRWGVILRKDSKVVWFELQCPIADSRRSRVRRGSRRVALSARRRAPRR